MCSMLYCCNSGSRMNIRWDDLRGLISCGLFRRLETNKATATATTTSEHPTDRSNQRLCCQVGFPATSPLLSSSFLLLLFSFLLLRVSLLFHPCIGFGLHLALAAAVRRSRHMTPRRRDRELQQMRDEGSFGSALPNWS